MVVIRIAIEKVEYIIILKHSILFWWVEKATWAIFEKYNLYWISRENHKNPNPRFWLFEQIKSALWVSYLSSKEIWQNWILGSGCTFRKNRWRIQFFDRIFSIYRKKIVKINSNSNLCYKLERSLFLFKIYKNWMRHPVFREVIHFFFGYILKLFLFHKYKIWKRKYFPLSYLFFIVFISKIIFILMNKNGIIDLYTIPMKFVLIKIIMECSKQYQYSIAKKKKNEL